VPADPTVFPHAVAAGERTTVDLVIADALLRADMRNDLLANAREEVRRASGATRAERRGRLVSRSARIGLAADLGRQGPLTWIEFCP